MQIRCEFWVQYIRFSLVLMCSSVDEAIGGGAAPGRLFVQVEQQLEPEPSGRVRGCVRRRAREPDSQCALTFGHGARRTHCHYAIQVDVLHLMRAAMEDSRASARAHISSERILGALCITSTYSILLNAIRFSNSVQQRK